MAYLKNITQPRDIQKLQISELPDLAREIRTALIYQSSLKGSHLGPCLGVVEIIMALYYVFDMDRDKVIFDVSHQSAVHKILSGRKQYYLSPETAGSISEFTNPKESPYDLFRVGHTSSALSLASGVVKARDMAGEDYQVIALVGDGALSGGLAWEGLNYISTLKTPCIIVLNDNEMSISENQGGIYSHLESLRKSQGKSDKNIFREMGLEYVYVENGHGFPDLIEAFQIAKKEKTPIVVHCHTVKGKGFIPAENNPEKWHSMKRPFNPQTGEPMGNVVGKTYLSVVPDYLIQKAIQKKEMVVITAGTAPSVGLTPEKRSALGQQFIDVGIAEEHAITMAAAMAKSGCRPVVCMYSSFLQRAYDQMIEDVALNKAPIVLVVYGGMMSGNDATHQGIFDVPMISQMPNITILAPATQQEVEGMLDWAIGQREKPVVIRLPRTVEQGCPVVYHNTPFEQMSRIGEKVAVVGVGGMSALADQIADCLAEKGLKASVIKSPIITPLNPEFWKRLNQNHQLIITIEDGSVVGGFGDKVAALYRGTKMRVRVYGAACEFIDREKISDLYYRYGLMPDKIAADILSELELICAG